MCTKGKAASYLKGKLDIDCCIYFGNDLNDISMFYNAIEDNDFIVIANNEYKDITNEIIKSLKEETKNKNINWNDVNLLLLKEKNVNSFLKRIVELLENIKKNKSA